MADDYEQTLLILKECFVYRIGPRPSAAGYKAQDWDPTKFIWSGRLVIVERGDKSTIRLEDPNSGELFATSPVDATSVEPVLDSSRYFVIKIQDGSGRHAFVGMGFTERNDAFDFNAAVQDHLKHVQMKQENARAAEKMQSQPKVDYSLKSGQTIHVELKGAKASSLPRRSEGGGGGGLGGGGILLPPPPKGRSINKPPGAQQQYSQPQQQQQQQQHQSDDFFSAFTSAPTQQQQQPQHYQQQQQQQQQPPRGNTDWYM